MEPSSENETGRPAERRHWMPILLGAILVLVWVQISGGASLLKPIIAVDIEQQRANTALPAPQQGTIVSQSFRPRHNGLREIEIIFARRVEAEPSETGRIFLRLFDDSGQLAGSQELQTRTIKHNQAYTFKFPIQKDSRQRRYQLRISGSSGNRVTVWGYSLDVYSGGEAAIDAGPLAAAAPSTAAKDLRFISRYQLTEKEAIRMLGTMLQQNGWIMLLALLFVPLPGWLMLLAWPGARRWDPAARLGASFALGVSGWSLAWTLLSMVGGRWQAWSLWMLFIIGWAAVGAADWRRWRTSRARAPVPSRGRWHWHHGLLLALLLLALAVRLLAVRDQRFPPWVDSSRHALITAVMADKGQIPDDYLPYLPVYRAPYHFGFHTLAASLQMMSRKALPQLLLFLGQLLNGLMPLMIYTGSWFFTKRRAPSLLAAFLAAMPFFFPAYYATWGRMTQLTAMLIMPVLIGWSWQLVRGGKGWRRSWWLVGLLSAGLFLVHFRVFLFYLPFAAVLWLVSKGRGTRQLAAAAGLALLLLAPRILHLISITEPVKALGYNIPNYNVFPISYVTTGWERQFITLATAALPLTVLAVVRRKRWAAAPMTLAAWVGVMFLLLAGEYIGLPDTSLVNLNSMYISLFLPLSIFLAANSYQVWGWLRRRHWLILGVSHVLIGGLLAAALLFGIYRQITILNPQTILARAEDEAGLAWAETHLPASAHVAVNSWLWLGATWAGSDGGAWLVPFSRLSSSTPPIDHIYDQDLFKDTREFNQEISAVSDWSDAAAAELLRSEEVTHVFVGARGGFFDPASLARNPAMELVYGKDGVFVFALAP